MTWSEDFLNTTLAKILQAEDMPLGTWWPSVKQNSGRKAFKRRYF